MARRVVTEDVTDSTAVAPRRSLYSLANIIYTLFGLLEILLAFRFVFLLLGANSGNGFVSFIYQLSEPFVAPFYGIFNQVSATTNVIASTFDPNTLVAMAVYAVIAWLIVRLLTAGDHRADVV